VSLNNVLFEPWSLGDAVIAASCLRELDASWGLVCDQRWLPLLCAMEPSFEGRLYGVSLPYTKRDRAGRFDAGDSAQLLPETLRQNVQRVVSARGDIRDYRFARKQFASARLSFTGWWAFAAWHYRALDLPHRLGFLPITNRYQMWFEAVGGSEGKAALARHQKRMTPAPKFKSERGIVLHMGAQWKSKQFPHVGALKTGLESQGIEMKLLASPGDPLPDGVDEANVKRVKDAELLAELNASGGVIVNESGVLHIARFIGVPTLVIPLTANVLYWAPIETHYVKTPGMPQGYAPSADYLSDTPSTRWPDVNQVLDSIRD
jgi:ADP-heptose:LPS heptosyltransferase